MTTSDRISETHEQLRLRIRQEFREMAGETLTVPQAMVLFGLDQELCERLLGDLVNDGFLRRTADGMYGRSDPVD